MLKTYKNICILEEYWQQWTKERYIISTLKMGPISNHAQQCFCCLKDNDNRNQYFLEGMKRNIMHIDTNIANVCSQECIEYIKLVCC